ncbi:MAG: PCRF domain-containing protein, partial [Aquificaceae bacterium]
MLSPELEERLKSIEQKYLELQYQLSSPEVVSDREKLTKLGKELKDIEEVYTAYKEYRKLLSDLEQAKELLKNEELKDLAKEEIERLT